MLECRTKKSQHGKSEKKIKSESRGVKEARRNQHDIHGSYYRVLGFEAVVHAQLQARAGIWLGVVVLFTPFSSCQWMGVRASGFSSPVA